MSEPPTGPERCWDHEDCPRDDCDGELQQQDRINVMCLKCERVFTHQKDDDEHRLIHDCEFVARKPRALTDGGTPEPESDRRVDDLESGDRIRLTGLGTESRVVRVDPGRIETAQGDVFDQDLLQDCLEDGTVEPIGAAKIRMDARSVPCPQCGAGAGEPCVFYGSGAAGAGEPVGSPHTTRMTRARDSGGESA